MRFDGETYMGDSRKNIKVSPETFERLDDDKPEGVTWSHYLDELHRKAHAWDERGSDAL